VTVVRKDIYVERRKELINRKGKDSKKIGMRPHWDSIRAWRWDTGHVIGKDVDGTKPWEIMDTGLGSIALGIEHSRRGGWSSARQGNRAAEEIGGPYCL